MVLRFYQLDQCELEQLYQLEDRFPEEVTVGETNNALAGERNVELIVGLAGPGLTFLLELIKLWAANRKKKAAPQPKSQNVIENLEIIMNRSDGSRFIIRADRIPADAAEKLLSAVGDSDEK